MHDVVRHLDPALAVLAHEGTRRYEELYDLVGVGTPVLVVQTTALRSQPAPPPGPTLEDLAEAQMTHLPAAPVAPGSPAAPGAAIPAAPGAQTPLVPSPTPSPSAAPGQSG